MSLANISVNTQPPGPLRASWLKRRQDSDNDDDKEATSAKVPRYSWYVTLESESPQPTDEDDESVYSVQGKETDFVADTSDTSTHTWVSSSSDSGDLSLHVEYEVASLSEGPNPFDNDNSSSDVSDIVAMGVLAFCKSDLGLANVSSDSRSSEDSNDSHSSVDSNDSRSSVDSEIGTADYWTCVQCNTKNNNPLFRYCEKCYQIKKNFFPPRPKWRKSRRELDSRKSSPYEPRGRSKESAIRQDLISVDSGLGSSQESKSSLTLDLNLDVISMPSQGKIQDVPTSSSLSSSSKESGDTVDSGYSTALTNFGINDSARENKIANNQNEFEDKPSSASSMNTPSESGSETFEKTVILSSIENNKGSKYRDKKNDIIESTRTESDNKLCITCTAAPKNGAFVHGAVTHICCCYRCAVKVWTKTKRCPICNRKVTNVLKAFYT